jgi:Ca-activated chloride channel family protein
MGPDDRFNILCFSGGNLVLAPESLAVTPDNVATAKAFMAQMQGGGGTEILGALRQALAMKTAGEYARTFVAVTDGYVSVEPQVFRTIRENLGTASFFAFGIGSSVNRFLIEGMARMGMGEPFIVMHGDDAVEKAAKFKAYIDSPALTEIAVKYEGFDAYDVEPASPPDLFASRPVLVFGKYRGAAKGKISVSGIGGGGRFSQTLDVAKYEATAKNQALRYLWARHRIATIADYQTYEPGDDKIAEITKLGLDYNLMTAYTSFVAVDQRVRNEGGDQTTVKQPLPLPDGVSDLAVGGEGRMGYMPAPSVAPMAPPPKTANYRMKIGGKGPAAADADEAEEIALSTREPAADKPTEPTLKPPVTKAAKVRIASLQVVSGPRGRSDVEAVLKRLEPQLTRCLEDQSAAAGQTVVLEVVIAKDGSIKSSRLVSSPVGDTVGRCLARPFALSRLAALPEGQGGDTVVRVTLSLLG